MRRCRWCDAPLVGGRRDRRYCDSSCRARAFLWRSQSEEFWERAWKIKRKGRERPPSRCLAPPVVMLDPPPLAIEANGLDSHGYVRVLVDGKWEQEHRAVMAQMIGRRLIKGESVHHKNGKRDDNRPENLELWVGPIRSGARGYDMLCPHCGKRYHG